MAIDGDYGFSVQYLTKLFHTASIVRTVDKAQLSKLRKKTGFPFINCKKALEKCNNDIKEAEQWLRKEAQKEGWAKATKLQGRAMSQGLVGLVQDNNMAAIVEVNCETDFVAKNAKFVDLVKAAAGACLQQGQAAAQAKLLWDSAGMSKLPGPNKQPLSDLVAIQIGALGENMAIQRGAFMMSSENAKLGSYVHAAGPNLANGDKQCLLGKYAAIVKYNHTDSLSQTMESKQHQLSEEDIGRQLAQHIVGMNPATVGNMEDFQNLEKMDSSDSAEDEKDASEKSNEISDDNDESEDDRMIFQEFLIDPDVRVGEFLLQHSIEVLDFVRFECGEVLPEEENKS